MFETADYLRRMIRIFSCPDTSFYAVSSGATANWGPHYTGQTEQLSNV